MIDKIMAQIFLSTKITLEAPQLKKKKEKKKNMYLYKMHSTQRKENT